MRLYNPRLGAVVVESETDSVNPNAAEHDVRRVCEGFISGRMAGDRTGDARRCAGGRARAGRVVRASIPDNPAWKSYVIGTGSADVAPVRIASVSGPVTNAEGLVDPSKGPATLTYTAGGRRPWSCSTMVARSAVYRSSPQARSRPRRPGLR